LLQERFRLVDMVKAAKAQQGIGWSAPHAPVREMEILKRLLQAAGDRVPQSLLVRLWRAIIADSTLRQAPVTVHLSKKLAGAIGHRLRLRDYFGSFAVEDWKDESQALAQVAASASDLCVVELDSAWAQPFLEGRAGTARVIATLPVIKAAAEPLFLVFGHGQAQASGLDETLLVSRGSLPRDFPLTPLWKAKSGSHRISAFAGTLSEHETPLIGLSRSNPGLGLTVAGRYASPLEI
jgi:chorismate mutase